MAFSRIHNLEHLTGRIGVFGDLHGVLDETMQAIAALNLDHKIFLGDINDRGPKVFELYEYVRDPKNNTQTITGNHDEKLARYFRGNRIQISDGMQTTVEQFKAKNYTQEQTDALRQYLEQLPHIIKLPGRYVCVHAGFNPTRALDEQFVGDCIRIRTFNPENPNKLNEADDPKWFEHDLHPDLAARKILFGHAQYDKVKVKDNVYSLDGGAVYGKELRVLVYNTEDKSETIHTYPCKAYYVKKDKDK